MTVKFANSTQVNSRSLVKFTVFQCVISFSSYGMWISCRETNEFVCHLVKAQCSKSKLKRSRGANANTEDAPMEEPVNPDETLEGLVRQVYGDGHKFKKFLHIYPQLHAELHLPLISETESLNLIDRD